jgi:glutaminyl-tRNA synthetase
VERALVNAKINDRFQFMRVGYFCADSDHTETAPVFNRTVDLKDSFKPGK